MRTTACRAKRVACGPRSCCYGDEEIIILADTGRSIPFAELAQGFQHHRIGERGIGIAL